MPRALSTVGLVVFLLLIIHVISPSAALVAEFSVWALIFGVWGLIYARNQDQEWKWAKVHVEMLVYLFISLILYMVSRFLVNIPIAALVALVCFGFFFFHHIFAVYLTIIESYSTAERYLSFLEQFFPNNISLLFQHNQLLNHQGDYKRAVQSATHLIDLISERKAKQKKNNYLNGLLIRALQSRAFANTRLENYEAVLLDAETWIEFVPDSPSGYFFRGTAFLHTDKFESATQDFTHVLSFQLPSLQRANAYNSLGIAEEVSGNYSLALESYTKSIQEVSLPAHKRAPYVNMGGLYFQTGDKVAAWNAYKTALELDPTHDHTLVGLAVLHADDDEWDEALAIWRTLLAKEPHFADPDEVAHRYYRWTPPMADLAREIITRVNASDLSSPL